jgi:glycosyltransferase involved in cell wall biosynthesis
MAQFVPEGAEPRFVMDFVDVDSAKFAAYADETRGPMRSSTPAKRNGCSPSSGKWRRGRIARCSSAKRKAGLFRRRTGLANVEALANGIDADFFDPAARFPSLSGGRGGGQGRCCCSPARWITAPRRCGVLVFTRGASADPHRTLRHRRTQPGPRSARARGERVTVTGAVADMRSWLAAADVVVAPLRIARGIQNKVLEAMAMARPVVASPAAFEGIEAEPGKHLLVTDGAEAMAEAISACSPTRGREPWAERPRPGDETYHGRQAGAAARHAASARSPA